MSRLLIAILLAMPALAVGQTTYKVQLPDGSIMFTDTPTPGAKVLEEREAKSTPRPTVPATPRPIAVPSSDPTGRAGPAPGQVTSIDAAMQEVTAAERALQVAKRRLELGREPLPGERLGLAGGGSRLSPEYEARIAGLEKEVANAEARVQKAYAGRNNAR